MTMAVFTAEDALESIDDVNGDDRASSEEFQNNSMSSFAKQQPEITTFAVLTET